MFLDLKDLLGHFKLLLSHPKSTFKKDNNYFPYACCIDTFVFQSKDHLADNRIILKATNFKVSLHLVFNKRFTFTFFCTLITKSGATFKACHSKHSSLNVTFCGWTDGKTSRLCLSRPRDINIDTDLRETKCFSTFPCVQNNKF